MRCLTVRDLRPAPGLLDEAANGPELGVAVIVGVGEVHHVLRGLLARGALAGTMGLSWQVRRVLGTSALTTGLEVAQPIKSPLNTNRQSPMVGRMVHLLSDGVGWVVVACRLATTSSRARWASRRCRPVSSREAMRSASAAARCWRLPSPVRVLPNLEGGLRRTGARPVTGRRITPTILASGSIAATKNPAISAGFLRRSAINHGSGTDSLGI